MKIETKVELYKTIHSLNCDLAAANRAKADAQQLASDSSAEVLRLEGEAMVARDKIAEMKMSFRGQARRLKAIVLAAEEFHSDVIQGELVSAVGGCSNEHDAEDSYECVCNGGFRLTIGEHKPWCPVNFEKVGED